MKYSTILIMFVFIFFSCTEKKDKVPVTDKEAGTQEEVAIPKDAKVYEVGCGLCVFDSDVPDSCESYVKIDGKVMPITGKVLDAHSVGLCEYKGTAFLEGEVKDGKFVAKFMKVKEFDKSKNYQE